ncbi:MAG: hypothetical protein ACI90V_005184 [Bacillariaceae sp.]|jgi:hypothetical protein
MQWCTASVEYILVMCLKDVRFPSSFIHRHLHRRRRHRRHLMEIKSAG